MRIAFLILVAALSGCNSSDDDSALQQQISAIPNEATEVAALRAQVTALQTKVGELQLIGKIKGQTTNSSPDAFRRMGEFTQAAMVSFGPCTNMGIFQGRGGSDSANPLASQFEIYKACTGYTTSYNESTGLHDVPHYAAWEGPDCTGTMVIITDVPQDTMSIGALEGGMVLADPFSGQTVTTVSGNVPQAIQIQSSWNILGGSCSIDIETRMAIPTVPNDVTVTGVAQSLSPGSWSIISP